MNTITEQIFVVSSTDRLLNDPGIYAGKFDFAKTLTIRIVGNKVKEGKYVDGFDVYGMHRFQVGQYRQQSLIERGG